MLMIMMERKGVWRMKDEEETDDVDNVLFVCFLSFG